jgi:LPS O-antigen subunit length determinant protein (WzzB/FepE family)
VSRSHPREEFMNAIIYVVGLVVVVGVVLSFLGIHF